MKRTLAILVLISFAVLHGACTPSPGSEESPSMEFSEEEVEESADEMEFTEEEVGEPDEEGMEFDEDEVGADEPNPNFQTIFPNEGTWLLTYDPGWVQCGSGPYIEGEHSLEESVTLVSRGGSGFDMSQSGQDRTMNFSPVYSREFLDPFADNFENYAHPFDWMLLHAASGYQAAFQEGGASFYLFLVPSDANNMSGFFWVLQDDCQLEKQVTATHQN